MANALAASLVPPVQDSAGARILKKMGWRMGQGIGTRITYEQKRAQDLQYEGRLEEGDDEDDEAKKHLYPRRDTPLLTVARKDNSHGLGYSPGMGLNESLGAQGGAQPKGPRISGTLYAMSRARVFLRLFVYSGLRAWGIKRRG
jgi:G patch domain-containing protein 1